MWINTRPISLNFSHRHIEKMFMRFDRVLGLKLFDSLEDAIPQEVKDLAKQREEARQRKDFETADRIRNEIQKRGFTIKDTPGGPEIEKHSL